MPVAVNGTEVFSGVPPKPHRFTAPLTVEPSAERTHTENEYDWPGWGATATSWPTEPFAAEEFISAYAEPPLATEALVYVVRFTFEARLNLFHGAGEPNSNEAFVRRFMAAVPEPASSTMLL